MHMIVKDSQQFWVPAVNKEIGLINSFFKWEQAFRVYSTIYVDAFPHRAKEIMQYIHTIFSASLTYAWDNVYAYDVDFRLFMSKNPSRNWGIILTKAWNVRLQDKLRVPQHQYTQQFQSKNGVSPSGNSRKEKKICWKYNSGKCTYGFKCKFDHRCGVCNKFGHGAHICHKTKPRSNSNGNNGKPFYEGDEKQK